MRSSSISTLGNQVPRGLQWFTGPSGCCERHTEAGAWDVTVADGLGEA